MSRFCFSRRRMIGAMALAAILGTTWASSAPSYADTSWVDILKPLVKDVIVPGANAGMKKLLEKKMNMKLNNTNSNASTSTSTSASVTTDTMVTMPEEPMSASNNNSDVTTSLPEEPTYQATATGPDSVAAPPPPPVTTP